ncbi:hypothetical protein JF737_24995, partial [Mycobacterium avium]|nr:hypothetical protein [Mycobacterium avium]
DRHAAITYTTPRDAPYLNIVLADDPALGPSCGLVVGVAPIRDQDGYYPLVWVAAP